MKILLADDHFLVLDGLKLLLNTFDFVESVESTLNLPELNSALDKQHYDVLFLDIHFGNIDGRDVVINVKKKYSDLKVIALTNYSDSATIKSAINAGFDGYLLKTDGMDEIEKALKAVRENQKYYSSETRNTFFENQTNKIDVVLTQREKEILQLIVQEYTTKEIAEKLHLSEKTVETHRGNLMLKLEARNIAGIVRKALMLRLVEI